MATVYYETNPAPAVDNKYIKVDASGKLTKKVIETTAENFEAIKTENGEGDYFIIDGEYTFSSTDIIVNSFSVDCESGINEITSSTTLSNGVFPKDISRIVSIFICNHSTDSNTKNNVETNNFDKIIINSEIAQNLTVKYMMK